LAAINTAANLNRTLLEVAGELKNQPTVNILLSPQWIEIRTVILASTEEFPGGTSPDCRGSLVDKNTGRGEKGMRF